MEVHRFRESLTDVLHPEHFVGVDLDSLLLEFQPADEEDRLGTCQGFTAFR